MKLHPLLSSRFSKRYNYEREDSKIIRSALICLKTVLHFGTDPDNIYNFDKTGLAIGLTITARVHMDAIGGPTTNQSYVWFDSRNTMGIIISGLAKPISGQ